MRTEDKLKEIYEGMLNEAPGKGFTLTCNKCGATMSMLKSGDSMTPKSKKIEFRLGGQEHGDGYSIGIAAFDCKCGNEVIYEDQ